MDKRRIGKLAALLEGLDTKYLSKALMNLSEDGRVSAADVAMLHVALCFITGHRTAKPPARRRKAAAKAAARTQP